MEVHVLQFLLMKFVYVNIAGHWGGGYHTVKSIAIFMRGIEMLVKDLNLSRIYQIEKENYWSWSPGGSVR